MSEKFIKQINEKSKTKTDISDHLITLYTEALNFKPKLLVELGVRGGESSYALRRACVDNQTAYIGVDIVDCSKMLKEDNLNQKNHTFILSDDILFSTKFKDFCKANNSPDKIDLLFIDTSHLYEHTVAEIKTWFPHLSSKCKVIFHDTNLKVNMKFKDETLWTKGWDNQRGVIRAIEEYLGVKINENETFKDKQIKEWNLTHYPYNSGLTILTREKYYPENSYFDKRSFSNKYYELALEISNLTNANTFYDVGCGEGFLVHAFNYINLPCEGYDISEYATKIKSYESSKDKISTKISDKTYECVTCLDVLEHIPKEQEEEFIKSLIKLTNKHLILSICDTTLKNKYVDPTHVNIRTRQYWIDKFKSYGFTNNNLPQLFPYKEQFYWFTLKGVDKK